MEKVEGRKVQIRGSRQVYAKLPKLDIQLESLHDDIADDASASDLEVRPCWDH